MALSEWDKAIQALEKVMTSDHVLSKNAQWYIGLAYLRTGERAEAQKRLMELEDATGYTKEAEEVLRRITK